MSNICPRCGQPNPAQVQFCGNCGQPLAAPADPRGGPRAYAPPGLLPTRARDQQFAGLTYHIEGELVPVLHIELRDASPVYFEHHVLLWKEPQVNVGIRALKGLGRRMLAGMQVFITQATGPGQVAFSRDGAGHVFGMHLAPGQEIDVREHQFLAASDGVDYTFTRVKGISNLLFGGSGFFIDRFICRDREGILWLHGYGNVFEKILQPGEVIDVEPGGWLYKDASVRMETVRQSLAAGIFASAGAFTFNRFSGPGRLGLQSMYLHLPTDT
jgi:uncharacterized protein (AIM24 family)